jgi:hypothetical protein
VKVTAFFLSVIGAAFLPVSLAPAVQITYVFAGTATGSLAGKSFSDVSFTVTAVADTASVPAPAAGIISFTPASVSITDSASSPLAIPNSYVFDNQNFQGVGFGVGSDDIQFHDPSFATYDMKTSTGPFFEASDPSVADWVNMSTSKGSLTVTSLTDLTFAATLASSSSGGTSSSSVPLPSAAGLSLVGLGLGAIIAYRRRRVAA